MLKLVIPIIALLASVTLCDGRSVKNGPKCYNGISQKDMPLSMSVRKQTCLGHYDRCVSVQYKSYGVAIGGDIKNITTVQSTCANENTARKACKLVKQWIKNADDCKVLQHGCFFPLCNKEAKLAEDEERKHDSPGKKIKCYTGQSIRFAPGEGMPIMLDECFHASKKCVTIKYSVPLSLYKVRVTQGMCADPEVKSYCDLMAGYMNIADCSEKTCGSDGCNKDDI